MIALWRALHAWRQTCSVAAGSGSPGKSAHRLLRDQEEVQGQWSRGQGQLLAVSTAVTSRCKWAVHVLHVHTCSMWRGMYKMTTTRLIGLMYIVIEIPRNGALSGVIWLVYFQHYRVWSYSRDHNTVRRKFQQYFISKHIKNISSIYFVCYK